MLVSPVFFLTELFTGVVWACAHGLVLIKRFALSLRGSKYLVECHMDKVFYLGDSSSIPVCGYGFVTELAGSISF